MSPQTYPFLALLLLISVALFTDIKWRKVPNWLIVTGLVSGVGFQIFLGNIVHGLLGFFIALVLTVPFFFLGEGLGAGDVKLLAVIGLYTSPLFFIQSFLYTAILGAILSLAAIVVRGKTKTAKENIKSFFTAVMITHTEPSLNKEDAVFLPYVVPIFLGTVLTMIIRLHIL